jgi:hypothetical protein
MLNDNCNSSKTLFCSSKFWWAREIMFLELIDNLATRPQQSFSSQRSRPHVFNPRPARLYLAVRGHICKFCAYYKISQLIRQLRTLFFPPHLQPANQPTKTAVALFHKKAGGGGWSGSNGEKKSVTFRNRDLILTL